MLIKLQITPALRYTFQFQLARFHERYIYKLDLLTDLDTTLATKGSGDDSCRCVSLNLKIVDKIHRNIFTNFNSLVMNAAVGVNGRSW